MSTPSISPLPALAVDSRPLPLSAKLLYGVGEMPITVLMVLSGLFMLFFYNSVMGLPPALVGIGLSFSLVLDAVLDPFIGHMSDRTSHHFGRRHIFMLPGALIVGPAFFLLFSPPRSLGHAGLFVWLVACSIALRASSAVYRIPYLSLGAELSRDYDDRTGTMGLRTLFGLAGTLGAAALSFLVFFPATADGSEPKLHYAGYPRMALAFGTLMTVSGLIGTLGTLGYRTCGSGRGATGPSFVSGFWIAMRNTHFRSIWLSTTVFFLAVVLNFSMAIHYFTWYAHIGRSEILSLIQTCFYSGALGGVVLWMSLARRTEKRTLYIMAMIASATLLLMATVLIGAGRPLGTGHALPLIVGHVVGGIFASAVWVVPASMIADVTDTDDLATGLRREGIYFGIMNFGEKIAAGGALLVAGGMLAVFRRLSHGGTFGTPGNPPAAIPFVGLLYGAVPAALLVISLIFILPYRLDRRTVHGIQEQLAARRRLPE
ncbi:MAG: MFS transporter [Bryobacteraceae bacterium]|jgi:GPH family glycoside/pentoside/hexuronide:cation symporter